MINCQTCKTSLQRHCNNCPARVAREVVEVLTYDDRLLFDNLMHRFKGAWKEMAET